MKILVTGGTNGMGKGVAKVLAGMDNQNHFSLELCGDDKTIFISDTLKRNANSY